jgi:3-dehydroquinate synthetase
MGIVIITRASTALGLCSQKECDEIISLISSYFMSVECPYSAIEISEIALSDKKRMGKYISLIMPYGIGNSKIYKIPVGELGHIFSLGLKGNSCG